MQNILLGFYNAIGTEEVADSLISIFPEQQTHESAPGKFVLVNKEEHLFLIPYHDKEACIEEWFEDDQKDIANKLQSFIEIRYRKIATVKEVLSLLSIKYRLLVIVLDDILLNSQDFLIKMRDEPEWDWRY